MSEVIAIQTHDVTVLKDVWVPMRDGVQLAADVYLPKLPPGGSAKVPALLTRTPYSKDAVPSVAAEPQLARPGMAAHGNYFASRGYAVVVQDVRGRYKSQGVWSMFET